MSGLDEGIIRSDAELVSGSRARQVPCIRYAEGLITSGVLVNTMGTLVIKLICARAFRSLTNIFERIPFRHSTIVLQKQGHNFKYSPLITFERAKKRCLKRRSVMKRK